MALRPGGCRRLRDRQRAACGCRVGVSRTVWRAARGWGAVRRCKRYGGVFLMVGAEHAEGKCDGASGYVFWRVTSTRRSAKTSRVGGG
eukprot:6207611-Prymnesium_polylepis.4